MPVTLRRERSEPRRATAEVPGPCPSRHAFGVHLRMTGHGVRHYHSLNMRAFVYMLRCADGSYYVGSATGDDLWKRVAEHETGA